MLSALLADRERQGKPIRVGLIGAGKFGGGLVAQIAQMQGMVVSAIADIDLARARYAYTAGYGAVAVGTADSPAAVAAAIHAGKFTVVEDGLLVAQAPQKFSLAEEGGLLSQRGVVELANSVAEDGKTLLADPLRMGVFVVARSEHAFTVEDLATYHLHPGGDGKNFLLYRPYHLVAVEAPITIAKVALYGLPTGAPRPVPTAEVIAVAKRGLKAGETLDGGGGYTVLGQSEKATVARQEGLLPLGLSGGAVLNQDVRQGDAIGYAMVDVPDSLALQLRREQDAMAGE